MEVFVLVVNSDMVDEDVVEGNFVDLVGVLLAKGADVVVQVVILLLFGNLRAKKLRKIITY